jgi:hypothetical protein
MKIITLWKSAAIFIGINFMAFSQSSNGLSNKMADNESESLQIYKHLVAKKIEASWRSHLEMSDPSGSGTVNVTCKVDNHGKVKGIRVVSSDRNTSLTECSLRSILDVKLPPIPADVSANINNNILEITNSFTVGLGASTESHFFTKDLNKSDSATADDITTANQRNIQPTLESGGDESGNAYFKPSELKIKGFYIGMDIHMVPRLLDKLLDGTPYTYHLFLESEPVDQIRIIIVKKNLTQADSVVLMKGLADQRHLFPPNATKATYQKYFLKQQAYRGDGGWFCANDSGQVSLFLFGRDLVNTLFNASDLGPRDFIQTFVKSYHIPEMNTEYGGREIKYPYQMYTSPEGVKIMIDDDKSLVVKKVPSKAEKNASFN